MTSKASLQEEMPTGNREHNADKMDKMIMDE